MISIEGRSVNKYENNLLKMSKLQARHEVPGTASLERTVP